MSYSLQPVRSKQMMQGRTFVCEGFGLVCKTHFSMYECSIQTQLHKLVEICRPFSCNTKGRINCSITKELCMLTVGTLLHFTTAGSISPEFSRFLKRFCGMLEQHDHKLYGQVMAYLRCWLSFALLRAAFMWCRGVRSAYHRMINILRPLAMAEGRL